MHYTWGTGPRNWRDREGEGQVVGRAGREGVGARMKGGGGAEIYGELDEGSWSVAN